MDRESGTFSLEKNRAGRTMIYGAAGLFLMVLVAVAYMMFFSGAHRHSSLPTIITGASAHAISPREIKIIDGDTIVARGRTIRLVGYDAAETGRNARCAREREIGDRATALLKALIAGGSLKLRMVSCACPPGTRECNFGRSCGRLLEHVPPQLNRRDS
jgi:hypothetical protein